MSVRELRDHGGEVLDRVARGTAVVVTRDGAEVAELRPRARRSPSSADLIARRRQLPAMDPDALAFDAGAARPFGRVAASLRSAGRKPAVRAYDALTAAAAIAEGVPLYTCDPHDFAGIDDLDVRAVPHPDRT
ncbi:type II toxin-antitoxin system prevent-host-death family antitoxin [Modestobacter italicus]|uniref:type II toxin-antitoxin system prevent-host-death family antitoxin n=1 Tax=Modestobacter italicus (strain DSM 44449 / CECT 9708 / BC 501) TaxID=2732864 RepID=UPI0027E1A875|nr:type II toxin-antitoxin system prevent-host-death family antitoxin [Modestobacter italicus]